MGRARPTIVWNGPKERGEALLSAISPDDPGDFEAKISGEGENVELRIVVNSDGLRQSRATVDDILACLVAAESGLDVIG